MTERYEVYSPNTATGTPQIYRDGPDGYLVVIVGKVTIFHMSVRVVQYVGKA